MNDKLIFGVGNSDKGKHPASIGRSPTKPYSAWHRMLERCYSKEKQEKHPTYIGCSVCDSWLSFQNFAEWYEANYPKDDGSYDLDKDLKVIDNKIYSPEACLFVSRKVNTFTIDCRASRGDCMIGVHWCKRDERFISRCSNPITGKRESLGLFMSELSAHLAWRKRKSQLAYELAMVQDNQEVADALLQWKLALDNNIIHPY